MEARFRDVDDAFWKRVKPLIPIPVPRNTLRGRPRLDDRRVLAGIAYRLRTGCQWKAIPVEFGSGSGVHKRFQEWVRAGVFRAIFELMLKATITSAVTGPQVVLDGWCHREGAKRGDRTGRNPTDRGKSGVKRSVLTDAKGIPIGVVIAGANVHDKWLVESTLNAIGIRGPRGPRRPKHLCMDKGYDYRDTERSVRKRRIIPHIRRRGEPPLIGCVRAHQQLAQQLSLPQDALRSHWQ